ncbi:MerR family transcriptional regulator [Glutamicibacter sp. BSL13]
MCPVEPRRTIERLFHHPIKLTKDVVVQQHHSSPFSFGCLLPAALKSISAGTVFITPTTSSRNQKGGKNLAHRPQASVAPERTYSISAAAQLAGAGVQSVRLYEARGLVTPQRTAGGTRKYSPADVARIERIVVLLDAGLNLAGIEMVLHLEEENHRLWSALHPISQERG